MSNKLSPTQEKVLELASRPQGLHPREPAFVIGRSNGKTQAAQALVRKGLIVWDGDRYRALNTVPVETKQEERITVFDIAIHDVIQNADTNAHKKPNMRTLMEEVAEAILADRGKHEHPLRLELMQIAGICINMIRQIDANDPFKP